MQELVLAALAGVAAQSTPPATTLAPFIELPSILPVAATAIRTMDAEIADVTGDGKLDIVLAGEFGPNVLLIGDGARYELARRAFGSFSMRDSEDIAIADFDGDGRLDVVFATEDDMVDEMFLGKGDGAFEDVGERVRPASGALVASNAVIAEDLNADGFADLVFGDRGPVRVLINNGHGYFDLAEGMMPDTDRVTQDLAFGDVDGDGDLDLLVANEDGNQLLINNGKGSFTDASEERLSFEEGVTEETREVDLADVDGDGDLDIFFANVGWKPNLRPNNRLLINNGQGWFTDVSSERLPEEANTLTTVDADFYDLDGDGDMDLVLGNMGQGGAAPVQVWLNDGAGAFEDVTAAVIPKLVIVNAVDVEVADLNGDGKPDIYVANHSGVDRVLAGT